MFIFSHVDLSNLELVYFSGALARSGSDADVRNSQTQYSPITPGRAARPCPLAQCSLHINFLRFHVNEGSCSRLIAGCAQACTENQFPVISREHVCCSVFGRNRGSADRKKIHYGEKGRKGDVSPDGEKKKIEKERRKKS